MNQFKIKYDNLIQTVIKKYPRPVKYYKNGKGTCKEQLIINEQLKNEFPNVKFNIHHIKPKCLGGKDDIENLVYMSINEHIEAHWLLFQMYAHDPEHCVQLCNAYGLVKNMLNTLHANKKHKNCKSIVQINPYTKQLICVYDSLSDAVTSIKHKNISSVLSGEKQTAGGYFWMYKTQWDNEQERNKILSSYNKIPYKEAWNKQQICQVLINNDTMTLVETFNSISDVRKQKHVQYSSIINVCNNTQKYCGKNKLIFMYKYMYDDKNLQKKFVKEWNNIKQDISSFIVQIDIDNKKCINLFENTKNIVDTMNIKYSQYITKSCRTQCLCNGYVWQYVKDMNQFIKYNTEYKDSFNHLIKNTQWKY